MKIKSIFKKKRSLKGGIEGISRGVVFGWAVSSSSQSLTLQFLINGTVIGSVRPTLSRPDIAAAASIDYQCGFRFDLKPYFRELNGVRLEIRDQATGESLPSTPIDLTDTVGWGAIDGIFGLEVKGWAVWANLDSEVVPVEILIDGEIAGCAYTKQPRSDLKKAGEEV